MAKSIAGKRVRLFRCQIPPLIGPKILNAHVPKDLGWEAEVDESCQGVLVKLQTGIEHFIPFTNIQTAEFYPDEAKETPKKLKAVSV